MARYNSAAAISGIVVVKIFFVGICLKKYNMKGTTAIMVNAFSFESMARNNAKDDSNNFKIFFPSIKSSAQDKLSMENNMHNISSRLLMFATTSVCTGCAMKS